MGKKARTLSYVDLWVQISKYIIMWLLLIYGEKKQVHNIVAVADLWRKKQTNNIVPHTYIPTKDTHTLS